jgi:hypothetical protein
LFFFCSLISLISLSFKGKTSPLCYCVKFCWSLDPVTDFHYINDL